MGVEEKIKPETNALEKANKELEFAIRELAHANRMKSEFVANMSHELRSPLNDILGFTQLLLGRAYGEMDKKQEEAIHLISESAHTLLSHINSILDLSKIESGDVEINPEMVQVNDLIEEILKSYSHLVRGRPIKIRMDLQTDIEPIYADKGKLRQIITNLIQNAFKFTKRGSIKVSTRKLADEAKVEICVEDTGIGIKKEDLEIIFEPFRQADGSSTREYGGTGLGLAITKNLLQMLEGEISVKSAAGVGSTFRLLLPLYWEKKHG